MLRTGSCTVCGCPSPISTGCCDLYTTDAKPLPLSTRGLCRDASAALAEAGCGLRVGLELELHLFDADTMTPIHLGWELLGTIASIGCRRGWSRCG